MKKLWKASGWLDIAAAVTCGGAGIAVTAFLAVNILNDTVNSDDFVSVSAVISIPVLCIFFGIASFALLAHAFQGIKILYDAKKFAGKALPSEDVKRYLIITIRTFILAAIFEPLEFIISLGLKQYVILPFIIIGLAAFTAALITKMIYYKNLKDGV